MKIPFIVVSGYSSKQLSGALAAAPIVGKPFSNGDLIGKLRLVLTAPLVVEAPTSASFEASA